MSTLSSVMLLHKSRTRPEHLLLSGEEQNISLYCAFAG